MTGRHRSHELVDWAGRVAFDIICKCGGSFQSQARMLVGAQGSVTITRLPCPKCERTDDAFRVLLITEKKP